MRLVKIMLVVLVAVWSAVWALPDGLVHVVFCDVGQGDAILIYRGTTQMLVDGGLPNGRVIGCLTEHMPFYDRTVEVVMATHPENDHIGGLVAVAKRYTVGRFVGVPVGKDTDIYKELAAQLVEKQVPVVNLYTEDVVKLGGMEFDSVWPTRQFVADHETGSRLAGVAGGKTGEVLGMATEAGMNLNDFSIGGIVKYGDFEVMLTGDADQRILPNQLATGRLRDVEVLKVPHHGSKYGMTAEWLSAIKPELAVISVGRNSYGHPTQEALEALKAVGAKVMRTDSDGEVEVVSDGTKWWVKK